MRPRTGKRNDEVGGRIGRERGRRSASTLFRAIGEREIGKGKDSRGQTEWKGTQRSRESTGHDPWSLEWTEG